MESKRGGARPGAGRKPKDRKEVLYVRIGKEAMEKLNVITDNKSEFIERLILEYKK